MVTNNHTEEEKEKKNKRRGLVFAFFFHVVFIILALIPFMTNEEEDKGEKGPHRLVDRVRVGIHGGKEGVGVRHPAPPSLSLRGDKADDGRVGGGGWRKTGTENKGKMGSGIFLL